MLDRDENTAAICEQCYERAKHLRCMRGFERSFWEADRIFYCLDCYESLQSENSSSGMGDDLYGGFYVDEVVDHNYGAWASVEEQLNFFAILE